MAEVVDLWTKRSHATADELAAERAKLRDAHLQEGAARMLNIAGKTLLAAKMPTAALLILELNPAKEGLRRD